MRNGEMNAPLIAEGERRRVLASKGDCSLFLVPQLNAWNWMMLLDLVPFDLEWSGAAG
jgi:hypothetical protein